MDKKKTASKTVTSSSRHLNWKQREPYEKIHLNSITWTWTKHKLAYLILTRHSIYWPSLSMRRVNIHEQKLTHFSNEREA